MIRYLMYLNCLAIWACSNGKTGGNPTISPNELIELNKRQHHAEIEYIQTYIDTLKWEMSESNTGIFYKIYSRGSNDTIRTGAEVGIWQKVSTLEIPPFKTSLLEGNKIVHVDNDVSEAGVHQALKMMCMGDSGIFIIPSHLAYGLTGLTNQVQPNTPLLYSIKAEKKPSP